MILSRVIEHVRAQHWMAVALPTVRAYASAEGSK